MWQSYMKQMFRLHYYDCSKCFTGTELFLFVIKIHNKLWEQKIKITKTGKNAENWGHHIHNYKTACHAPWICGMKNAYKLFVWKSEVRRQLVRPIHKLKKNNETGIKETLLSDWNQLHQDTVQLQSLKTKQLNLRFHKWQGNS